MRGGGGRKFTTILSSSTNEKLHEAPQQSSFVTPWHTHQFSYSMQTQIWLRIENNGIIWRRGCKTEYYDFLLKWNTPRLFHNESHREGNIKWSIKTKEGWFSFEQTPEHERLGQVNEWMRKLLSHSLLLIHPSPQWRPLNLLLSRIPRCDQDSRQLVLLPFLLLLQLLFLQHTSTATASTILKVRQAPVSLIWGRA